MNTSIVKIILNEKLKVLFLALCSICVCLSELAVPAFISIFIDDIITPHESSSFIIYLIVFVGLSFFAIMANYVQNVYSAAICGQAINNLLLYVINHIKKVPYKFFHKYEPSLLARRIDDDVVDVVMFVLGNMAIFFSAILNATGVIILVYRISYVWVIILSLFICLYVLYFNCIGKRLKAVYREYRNSTNNYFSKISEFIINIKSIKSHSAEIYFMRKIEASLLRYYIANIQRAKVSFFLSNNRSILNSLFYISLFSVGTYQVFYSIITVGQFVSLIGYFNIIITSVSFFISLEDCYQNASVASSRLTEILEEKVDSTGSLSISKISTVEIVNLNKSYEDRLVISNFNYTFSAGNTYCIEGPNGTGKSTILSMLIGLEKPDSGDILFNSISFKALNFDEIRKNHIAVCEQTPFITEDSLDKNLFFDEPPNKLAAEDKYGVLPKINNIENKKIIPELLSGGERQRISLLRAILKDASLILLDEPTSALDKEGVKLFINMINELSKDKIVIVVSHDKNVISNCSYVVHLQ
ncbi:ABC transporter ATP-binding protein [uncultured Phascolarctobacterium sp.]|uniref:ABC transporter transmembrane domain-containing protein n=1 Tax=uncultured Phascolarctobacterium sp. TaxID=512296 RepID=UPI0025E5DC22|nr:ABC transporter ATP-binding protein [uncultured Phascolarctobacterium sp.]